MPMAGAPSGSRRRHSPISSGPPSPLDTPTELNPSPRLRQPLQPSSAIFRPRAVRPSSSMQSETSDVPLTQLPSSSLVSVNTTLSEMPNSTDLDSLSASRPSLDVPSSGPSINRPSSAVFAPSEFRRSPSPASSSHSKTKGKLQPHIASVPLEQTQSRRDQNARISFFDPANQSALDRLIFHGFGMSETEGEEESTQDIMANVEEMLEGYEWASDDILGRTRSGGAVDQIAARLLDELMALEKVFGSTAVDDGARKRFTIGEHSFVHRDGRSRHTGPEVS